MINKIMALVMFDDEFLLLKGSDNDPQFGESFWYVVTGAVEKYDLNLEAAVKREVKEETGLDTNYIKSVNWYFEYYSLGKKCIEKVFVVKGNNKNVVLNEESIDFKWCKIDEFVNMIKWYSSKSELKEVLEKIVNNDLPFPCEKIEIIS